LADTKKIVAYPENCTGCLLCAMRCSLAYLGMINPLKARLIIRRRISGSPGIIFTDECNDCGLCAKTCTYGALAVERKGD